MDDTESVNNDRMCFACGKDNPISLGLDFEFHGNNKVKAVFVPDRVHQGFNGIIHGGIITTVLDEAMAKVINMKDIKAVTADLKVRFKKTVTPGDKFIVKGILKDKKKKIYYTEAYLVNEQDEIYAEAEARFI